MIEFNPADYAEHVRSMGLEHGQATMVSPDGLHVFTIIRVTDEEIKKTGNDPDVEWTVGRVPHAAVPVYILLVRFAESDELVYDMPLDISNQNCLMMTRGFLDTADKFFMLVSDNDHTLIKVTHNVLSPVAFEIAIMKKEKRITWDTQAFGQALFSTYFAQYPKPVDAWKQFAGV